MELTAKDIFEQFDFLYGGMFTDVTLDANTVSLVGLHEDRVVEVRLTIQTVIEEPVEVPEDEPVEVVAEDLPANED